MGTPGEMKNRNLTQSIYEFMRKHPGMIYFPKGLADELDLSSSVASVGAALSRMVTIPQFGIVRAAMRGGYYYAGSAERLQFNERGHREEVIPTPVPVPEKPAPEKPVTIPAPVSEVGKPIGHYEFIGKIGPNSDLIRSDAGDLYAAIPFRHFLDGTDR